MPQSSYLYSVSHIRALEKGLIKSDRLKKMLEGTAEDALHQLVESGYGGISDVSAEDYERLISAELYRAKQLINDITPDETITDLFLMKADIQNLKLLLKLKLQDISEETELESGGIYDKAELKLMVRDGDYSQLPETIAQAMAELDSHASTEVDPQKVSVTLDNAYMQHAMKVLDKHPNEFALNYFRALADFNNMLAFLRLKAMGASKDRLELVLLDGGYMDREALVQAYEADEPGAAMDDIAFEPLKEALQKGLSDVEATGRIALLERARDNYIIGLARETQSDIDTLAPVISYLLAREQEAVSIRLIMTAKRNGLPAEVIEERLRELYG